MNKRYEIVGDVKMDADFISILILEDMMVFPEPIYWIKKNNRMNLERIILSYVNKTVAILL